MNLKRLAFPCAGAAKALGLLACAALSAGATPAYSAARGDDPPTVEARSLDDALRAARPGDVVVLPAGVFDMIEVVPNGVSLRGAGIGKTILDARARDVGLRVEGGGSATISDFTIRNARRVNLAVSHSKRITIARVRSTGSITGINLVDVANGRVENSICDENRYGIITSGCKDTTIVNCTLARDSSIGLVAPSGTNLRIFNNCVTDAATGVFLGDELPGLRLDHNLYFSLFVGKSTGQVGRKTIGDWRSASRQDARSVRESVVFRNPATGDFHPVNPLPWSLDRASTSDWGVDALDGVLAPTTDADGRPRVGRPDVGAFEVALQPPRPADGSFSVRNDAGLKSAGLFSPGERLAAVLFQDLPLPTGSYPYWLPPRDQKNRPIGPGTYEIRVVESDLQLEYLGWIGDSGAAWPASKTAPVNPIYAVFDGGGRLIVAHGWSEDGTNLRGYDAKSGEWLWSFGGQADVFGLAAGPEGENTAYFVKPSGNNGQITRINTKDGSVARPPAAGSSALPPTLLLDPWQAASGLAVLGDRLFVATSPGVLSTAEPTRGSTLRRLEVDAPSSPCADSTTGLIWLIEAGKSVVALDREGKPIARHAPAELPTALAAGGGLIAVASRTTGKVHIFDARDPKSLKPLRTVGRGDGPFGAIEPDRFRFQFDRGESPTYVNLAMGPGGMLAACERGRVLVFDGEGKPLWSTFGIFGNGTAPSWGDPTRLFDTDGAKSFRLDESASAWKAGGPSTIWRPELYLDVPRVGPLDPFLGAFDDGGKTFGLWLVAAPDQEVGLLITRLDGARWRPLALVARDPKSKRIFRRVDANEDGVLDGRDPAATEGDPTSKHPLLDGFLFARSFTFLQANGDLLTMSVGGGAWGVLWRRAGLDDKGVPIYRADGRRAIPLPKAGLISPYDGKPDPTNGLAAAELTPDGGLIGLVYLKSTPESTGLLNSCGTDVARFDDDGEVRWVRTLSDRQGLMGLSTTGPVTFAGVATTCEVIATSADGLGLGTFGFGPDIHYEGYFLDHPQALRSYRGRDGRIYLITADNFNGRQHWRRLVGEEKITTTVRTLTIDDAASKAIAAAPSAISTASKARPATPTVRIPRLDAPLAIDGDLAKWRRAGIAPQVIITPDTAGGGIDGPRDVSCLVRLAYRGDDLYAQFLTFDDVPVFHQTLERHYKQDGVEMILNGFARGFKFDATITTDAGPIVLRQRFYLKKLDKLLTTPHCPRVIKVLKDARDVPERALIESVYGVNLADSPVIVTEFKLPIDAETYAGSEAERIAMKPGQTFRLGFLINDNDAAGTDVQNYLVWPATYSNFGPLEDSAIAILE